MKVGSVFFETIFNLGYLALDDSWSLRKARPKKRLFVFWVTPKSEVLKIYLRYSEKDLKYTVKVDNESEGIFFMLNENLAQHTTQNFENQNPVSQNINSENINQNLVNQNDESNINSDKENLKESSSEDKSNLSETELQIKRMEENLKKLRLKAQREKKQKQIDSAMNIYSLLKKHGLQNIDIEIWKAKIEDIAKVLKN